ncbi:DUF11 domain-containing protein [Candidatus Saccharibacteria bacterium]|nr:DUF11 domain-containing protein [Candidatus Saccharibacteria bacterium]
MKTQNNTKLNPRAVLSILVLGFVLVASLLFQYLAPAVFAWGPADRETFTMESPAPFRTFNSITNNPVLGDERNFVRIREAGVGTFGNEAVLIPGRQYEVYIFFHNNAACNLNQTGAGVAQNVRMRSSFPAVVNPGERALIGAEISSTNTTPLSVWDHVYITNSSAAAVSLRYVPASAIIHSSGAVNGRVLPSSLFGEGTFLGFNELNGIIPGCAEFSGHVIYRIVVDQPNFEITKSVSREGANDWQNSLIANPGDIVEFRIHYRNTGTVDQVDVTLLDTLPDFLEFIPGSTRLVNNADPNGSYIADGITTTGVNIGTYGPGAEAIVTFRVRVASYAYLPCGNNTLQNTVAAITDNGTKRDTAYVNVNNDHEDCDPVPPVTPGPELPPELPVTGPLEFAMVATALLALTIGLVYWYNSHIAIQKAHKAIKTTGKAPKDVDGTDVAIDAPDSESTEPQPES